VVRNRLVTRPLDPERDTYYYQPPCALTDDVRSQIQELDTESARLVWNELIRRNQYLHPNQLPRTHWSRHAEQVGPDWVAVWNRWIRGEQTAGLDPVGAFLRGTMPWPGEVPVLFVIHRDHATLATWGAFLAAWPHFLYCDEGPLLVSWERPEFVAWGCGGFVGVGRRC
jgi:hypothetical protein